MRARRPWLLALGIVLGLTLVTALGVGPRSISPAQLMRVIGVELGLQPPESVSRVDRVVITQLRAPRAILGALVGAVLAVAGASLQGLFRNPLADPGLIGVTTGAAAAAATGIVFAGLIPFGAQLGPYLVPVFAFVGALLTTLTVAAIARQDGHTRTATLLLAGIALAALAGALIGLLVYLSDDQQLRDLQFWMMGSLGGAEWRSLAIVGPILLLLCILLSRGGADLNCILLGEREAQYLGVDVERLKRRMIWCIAAGVGAAVSLAGSIGFVGLVVPHLLRLSLGPDHRLLLPASALLGGTLLLVADLAARTWAAPSELPIGIMTSLVGGPFLLWLVVRDRSRGVIGD
ncbi:MAG: iron ABC transporter permease [Planctomycetota bacterium]